MSARLQRIAHTLLIVCALGAAGCSASYFGERLFWKAQQLAAPISKDPAQASPEQIAKAIDAFERVITKAAGTVWAARAQAAVGALQAIEKHYDQAREAYTRVLQNYSQYQGLAIASRVAIAKTYEIEGKWDEAVKTYQELADRHQWTRLGLEAPLYIASVYEKRHDAEMATRAYERAIRTYTLLIPDAPMPAVGLQVKSYLASAYQRTGNWEQAIATLEELLQSPSGINQGMVLLTLATINQTKLNAPEKAIAFYTRLVKELPDDPLTKLAKAQLDRLQPGWADHAADAPPVAAPAQPTVD